MVSLAATDLGKPAPRTSPRRPPANPHTHLQSSASPSGAGLRGVSRQMWEAPGCPLGGAQGRPAPGGEQLEVSSSGKRPCSGDMNELRMWTL